MDRRTAEIYERRARTWIAQRALKLDDRRRAVEFAARLGRGARVADLGCGPGWYATVLRRAGLSVVGLDLTRAMLVEARKRERRLQLVRADLAHLPFARESLDGAWARNSYIHVPERELAGALAELHRALRPGARIALTLVNRAGVENPPRAVRPGLASFRQRGPEFRGRLFVAGDSADWRARFEGAGFTSIEIRAGGAPFWFVLNARRARTLPDRVRPGLRLLVCGLNPSLVAADSGIPFAGATNRFWAAAQRAGLVSRERDVRAALARGIGFTDLVKRASAGADALSTAEYRRGVARVSALVERLAPRAVLFVGLDGYRRAVDARARPGVVRGGFAGRRAYLMPSTSGRNATTTLAALVAHLRRASRLTGARASG
jgi:TDG/mug DNA glycosylase family protein